VKPLITVIIPCYNHKRYIIDCIHSVANQDVGGLELVIVDDCSPDGSYDFIIEAFEQKKVNESSFVSCKIMSNERNIGAHNSLNKGLDAALGDYIAILNSDDQYECGRLSKALSYMESSSADFVFTGVQCIDELSNAIDSPGRMFESSLSCLNQDSFDVEFLRRNPAITSGNLIFKRKLLEDGLRFKGLKYCHDWDFLLSAHLAGSVGFIDEPLYKYRFHGSNSFRGLSHVADQETLFVLSEFMHGLYRCDGFDKLFGGYQNWKRIYRMVDNLKRAEIINSCLLSSVPECEAALH
jgi:glycosyltransferase involved in cell wall biosynthesis